jgi:hypothetical protein
MKLLQAIILIASLAPGLHARGDCTYFTGKGVARTLDDALAIAEEIKARSSAGPQPTQLGNNPSDGRSTAADKACYLVDDCVCLTPSLCGLSAAAASIAIARRDVPSPTPMPKRAIDGVGDFLSEKVAKMFEA